MTDTECGTRGGWNRHMRNGEKPCADCNRANTAYMREYRANHGYARDRDRLDSMVRNRALARLALEHPADYTRFLAEERARMATTEGTRTP